MKYKYCAVIEKNNAEGCYLVDFPDIDGCFTEGDTLDEAMEMAEDVLNLMLVDKEEEHEAIPPASLPEKIALKEGQFLAVINADTTAYREMNYGNVNETNYLNSIPGMSESLIRGKETPIEDCLSEDEVLW